MAPPPLTDREVPIVVTNSATVPQRASRLPSKLRFPIFVFLNFFVTNTIWSIIGHFLPPELGIITKIDLDDSAAVFGRLAFRLGFLWTLWRLNYDWIDVSALAVLATAPYSYLVSTYYKVSNLTVAAYASIEVLSMAFPIMLLRPRSKIHNPNASLRNRFLLESFQVQTSTALLAIGVYSVVLWCALKTGILNSFLVTHFDMWTVEPAHNETPLSLAAKVATVGIAARTFLLNSSIGAQTAPAKPIREFDPATATLPETLKHNFWFFSKRTRTLIRQTAVLTVLMFANTVQRTATLRESDWVGPAGYASVWVLATLVTAGWWAWIGDTEA